MEIKPPNTKPSISLVSTIFGCLVAGIIFALILVIFMHPVKYSFYFFSLTLAGLLFFIIFRYRDGFEIAIMKPVRLVDCVMMIFASIILFSNIIGSYSSEVIFLTALIVVFFLPGWALLRALGLDRIIRGSIELFVLSFSLSVITSALILLSGLFLQSHSVAFNKFVTLVFFSISIIPFITRWWIGRKESVSRIKARYNYSELFCIAWLSIFFIFVIWNLYPGMAYVPGNDIVRHYSIFKQVFQSPDIYFTVYPWFHSLLALLDQISLHPSMELMQSGLAMMSIIVIFSFYMMARSYLRQIDSRAPMIATILFTAFAGFGWIYFLQQADTISDIDQEWDVLNRSHDASYYDIGIGGPTEIWLWFRPLTLGFAILFVLLYLLNSKELSMPIYVAITSALVLALMQIHTPELVVFTLLIWVAALFFPSIKLRTKETAISILIGIACSSILSYSYSYIFSPRYASELSDIQVSLIAVLAGTSLIFLRKTERIKFGSLKINWNLVIAILGAAYLILLYFWNSISDNFKLMSVIGVYEVYGIPWEFYPLLLGIVGLLAIPGMIIILKNSRNHPVVIFVALFLLTMVLGRALTFLNANSMHSEYYERRLIPIMQASASVVASIVILQIVRWLESRNQRSSYAKHLKSLLSLTTLSILILAGSLSTFSTFEFQTLSINSVSLTDMEKTQSPYGRFDPYTTILTVGGRSKNIAEFSLAGYIPHNNNGHQLWTSQSPELPLKFLYGLNNSAVLYLSPNDIDQIIENNYAGKYLVSHLLSVSLPYNSSSIVGTHQLPKLVPVAPKSDTVLVVPESVDRRIYYAYDILSQSGYNYTTAFQFDINSISKARIIIAPSETLAIELIRHKKDYNLQYQYLIVLNLDGYGKISRLAPANPSLVIDLGTDGKWTPMTTVQDLSFNSGSTQARELNTTASAFSYTQEGDYGLQNNSSINLGKPLNLTDFDFAYLSWNGRGDGKSYRIQFSSGSKESFSYTFEDSIQGSQQIVLPLQKTPEKSMSGVDYRHQTSGNPFWSKIVGIELRAQDSSQNAIVNFSNASLGFSKWLNSSSIEGPNYLKRIQFPSSMSLPPITIESNYTSTAYYDGGVPFVSRQYSDSHTIYHFNLYPLVQNIDSNDNNASAAYYKILGKIMGPYNLPLKPYEFKDRSPSSLVADRVAAFENVTFSGDLSIKSTSAIVVVPRSTTMTLRINGDESQLENVSQITPIDSSSVTINASKGTMSGGSGFYSSVSLDQSLISFSGQPVRLILENSFGNQTSEITASNIEFLLSKAFVLIREPQIDSTNATTFNNFYGYGELFRQLGGVLGSNLFVTGKTSFQADYFDEFIIISDLAINGEIIRSDPVYGYDELGSLINLSSDHIVLFAMVGVVLYFFSRYRIIPNRESTWFKI
jgi:hypothetical protein